MGTCNYIVTWNNIKLVHWSFTGELLHLIQQGGDWAKPQPAHASPRCTKCNSSTINGQCTAGTTVLLYNGSLLCSFNVPLKGLITDSEGLGFGTAA